MLSVDIRKNLIGREDEVEMTVASNYNVDKGAYGMLLWYTHILCVKIRHHCSTLRDIWNVSFDK